VKIDWGPFRDLLRPHRASLIEASLAVMGVAALNLALLWLFRYFFDHVLVRHDATALGRIIWAALALFAAHGLLSVRQHVALARMGQRLVTSFRLRVVEHLTRLSLDFFVKRRTGELLSRVTNDIGTIQNLATTVPVDLTKQAVTLVGAVGLLFYMNWRLCLVILGIVPLVVLVARGFGRRLKALSIEAQDRAAESTTILEEMISGIKLVKSFVMERHEVERLSALLERADAVALRRARLVGVFVPVITLVTLVGALGILWFGGVQVMAGAMTPGLVAFLLYGGILMGPFSAVARLFTHVKEAQGAMQRVTEILNERPTVDEAAHARSGRSRAGSNFTTSRSRTERAGRWSRRLVDGGTRPGGGARGPERRRQVYVDSPAPSVLRPRFGINHAGRPRSADDAAGGALCAARPGAPGNDPLRRHGGG
jgi:subfamily B ATP-binding cassette protein MsbA